MAAIDNHVLHYLKRDIDFPPSAREIAEGAGLSLTTVNASLRRMEGFGLVQKLGVTGSGARTWGVR